MKDHPLHCAGNNNSIIGSLNHSIVPSKNDGDIKTFVAISAKSITIVGDMEITVVESRDIRLVRIWHKNEFWSEEILSYFETKWWQALKN